MIPFGSSYGRVLLGLLLLLLGGYLGQSAIAQTTSAVDYNTSVDDIVWVIFLCMSFGLTGFLAGYYIRFLRQMVELS